DSTNENSSDNNTTTTDTSYNEPVTLEASPIVCKVNSDQTATIRGVTDTADSTLDIPSTVEINGKEYPVTEIEAEAFKGNRNIREITGGHNIVFIGKAAFSNCKNLRTVDLSQTDVKTIGAKAFNGCGKLKKVKLNGDYLKKVGSKAFNKLNKEVKITIYARNKKTYNKLVTKVTKAGAKNAKFKSKKSLGIKYN
nr:leucine-rich repeat domain-containing protein [Butyrivibrio sp.]